MAENEKPAMPLIGFYSPERFIRSMDYEYEKNETDLQLLLYVLEVGM